MRTTMRWYPILSLLLGEPPTETTRPTTPSTADAAPTRRPTGCCARSASTWTTTASSFFRVRWSRLP
uniref:Putative secreted protein n=1 Tax=Ixodes ricinus TaxID=34613 RepID=A0A6B0TQG1_IXORI